MNSKKEKLLQTHNRRQGNFIWRICYVVQFILQTLSLLQAIYFDARWTMSIKMNLQQKGNFTIFMHDKHYYRPHAHTPSSEWCASTRSLSICIACSCLSIFGRKTKFSDRLDKMSLWMRVKIPLRVNFAQAQLNWGSVFTEHVSLGQCHLSGWTDENAYSVQRWSSVFLSVSDYMGYNGCEWSEVKSSWRRVQMLPLNQLSIYFPCLWVSECAWANFFSYFLLL